MTLPAILPNWHPIAIHFPIALLTASTFFFALGGVLAERDGGTTATVAARWNLGFGVVVSLAALATGWHAYNTVAHDDASHANMTVHMKWAFAAAGLFIVAGALAWFDRRRSSGAAPALFGVLLLGCGALAVTGWLGGENVYRFGLGVASLPKPGHHHHHEEGEEDHGGAADADHDMPPPTGTPEAPGETK